MFFSAKYARALGKLGLSGPIIESFERKIMLQHCDSYKRLGATPIEAAVSYFTTVIGTKIQLAPNIYIPVAIAGQGQILEWVATGKVNEETANEAIQKIINAIPSE